ncbi:hypothetical protein [Colidextribacter sp. OB.20]|uniref:hypothetical protein n=1 Tax=Colidextribacter sp. OB.20 TaxID=2304568 RepID=UPI001FAC708F|nr:hypothetical protein [Colidextribacter sp. OB.20]
MEEEKKICPVCGTEVPSSYNHDLYLTFYRCPVCGQYQLDIYWKEQGFNMNHLAAFLAHNAYPASDFEQRYYTTASREVCDELQKEGKGHPVHIDSEIVEAWYPRSFAEKIDLVLLYLHKHAPHIGQTIHFTPQTLYSFLFIDRYDFVNGQYVSRKGDTLEAEARFIISCLIQQGLIADRGKQPFAAAQLFTLTPYGYARIDEIQRYTASGRNVLVAMQFGDETRPLREAIRKGIESAEYHAIFIDEVQHNDFITPELLKYIRDSKFVVVDLTHQNNGAYFEEGYSMGLGKPVIQLCKQGVKLHFDIAQKNTIMWETEDDIPELLQKRIIATIE